MYTLKIDNFVINSFGIYSCVRDNDFSENVEREYRNKKIDKEIRLGDYIDKLKTKIEISKIMIEDNIKELSKIQEDLDYIDKKYNFSKRK